MFVLICFCFFALNVNAQEGCTEVCEMVCENQEESTSYDYSEKIQLSELLPNPEGSDSGEWIELYNAGSKKINLLGWQLSDGRSTYKFKSEDKIKAHQYLLIPYEESHISLNNSGESIYLFDPDEKKIATVTYADVKEAWSYALFDGQWFWTNTLTPEAENIISDETEESADSTDSEEEDLEEEEEEGEEEEEEENTDELLSILDARSLAKGTAATVEGVVTVEPGILTSQIFYIEDETAGIQIYSSKKTFPELTIGDYIQVQGEVSEAYNEKKINIKAEEDIEILGAAEISIATVEAIGEELEGQLVSTESQIVDKASNKIYLANDIIIYFKSATGISTKAYEEGDLILFTGIVGEYKGEYRLMPRALEDIEVLSKYEEVDNEETNSSIIKAAHAAEKNEEQAWALPTGEEGQNVIKYLLIVVAILVVGIGVVFWKSDLREKLFSKLRVFRNTDTINKK